MDELFPAEFYWRRTSDGDPLAFAIFCRHYSYFARTDRRRESPYFRSRKLIVGPGEKLVLLAHGPALFVWRKFIDDSGQQGVNCAVFRNEGPLRSSALIREACLHAWRRWPGQRLYTYVNPAKIRSHNPDCCFKKAGWKVCGKTPKGLIILELTPIHNS